MFIDMAGQRSIKVSANAVYVLVSRSTCHARKPASNISNSTRPLNAPSAVRLGDNSGIRPAGIIIIRQWTTSINIKPDILLAQMALF